MAELKDPKEFPKSLALLQSIDISLYAVAAIVIYCYAGTEVESPALGSAGPLFSKITYGIAWPTVGVSRSLRINRGADYVQIVIAGVINGHVACKAVYLRLFAGTDRMHKRDFGAVRSWIAIGLVLWVLAWIIASATPVFSNLLSLIVCSNFRLEGIRPR